MFKNQSKGEKLEQMMIMIKTQQETISTLTRKVNDLENQLKKLVEQSPNSINSIKETPTYRHSKIGKWR